MVEAMANGSNPFQNEEVNAFMGKILQSQHAVIPLAKAEITDFFLDRSSSDALIIEVATSGADKGLQAAQQCLQQCGNSAAIQWAVIDVNMHDADDAVLEEYNRAVDPLITAFGENTDVLCSLRTDCEVECVIEIGIIVIENE